MIKVNFVIGFFYHLPKNFVNCFWKYNFLAHLAAIILTYIIVTSGLDWVYFEYTRNTILQSFLFPAVALGGFLPLLVPVIIFIFGKVKKSLIMLNSAYALGQAALLGLFISGSYKAFTGRVPPEFPHGTIPTDISRIFQFGFLRGGVFWGWPSTHTTIAFAMAAALVMGYPKNMILRVLAIVYALYVGIGVSVSIHWFSDFVAGALIGTVIGIVVGKSFRARLPSNAVLENKY